MWEDAGVIGVQGDVVVTGEDRMPGAAWFPDARLNFAQNLLERARADDTNDALVFWGEEKIKRSTGRSTPLPEAIAAAAAAAAAEKSD